MIIYQNESVVFEIVLDGIDLGFLFFDLAAEVVVIAAVVDQQDQDHDREFAHRQKPAHCVPVQRLGDGLHPQDVHDDHNRGDHEVLVLDQTRPGFLRLS